VTDGAFAEVHAKRMRLMPQGEENGTKTDASDGALTDEEDAIAFQMRLQQQCCPDEHELEDADAANEALENAAPDLTPSPEHLHLDDDDWPLFPVFDEESTRLSDIYDEELAYQLAEDEWLRNSEAETNVERTTDEMDAQCIQDEDNANMFRMFGKGPKPTEMSNKTGSSSNKPKKRMGKEAVPTTRNFRSLLNLTMELKLPAGSKVLQTFLALAHNRVSAMHRVQRQPPFLSTCGRRWGTTDNQLWYTCCDATASTILRWRDASTSHLLQLQVRVHEHRAPKTLPETSNGVLASRCRQSSGTTQLPTSAALAAGLRCTKKVLEGWQRRKRRQGLTSRSAPSWLVDKNANTKTTNDYEASSATAGQRPAKKCATEKGYTSKAETGCCYY